MFWSGIWSWVATSIALGLGTTALWLERRRARAQLHAMDDRALADLGIHRSQVDAVVRGGRPGTETRRRMKQSPGGF